MTCLNIAVVGHEISAVHVPVFVGRVFGTGCISVDSLFLGTAGISVPLFQ